MAALCLTSSKQIRRQRLLANQNKKADYHGDWTLDQERTSEPRFPAFGSDGLDAALKVHPGPSGSQHDADRVFVDGFNS